MAKNWYPVINEDICIECGKCVKFCSHGVYDRSKNKPDVIQPDECIDHCHGCGGICPNGAITYKNDDTGWIPPNALKSSEIINKKGMSEMSENNNGCSCGSDCSCNSPVENEITVKPLNIDFLYLDLNTCERCIATGDTLYEAIDSLAPMFKTMNYEVNVNKVNITTKELAEQYKFESSPTIRVNGIDICDEVKESSCQDCSDISGCSTDCRVFVYDGKDYEQPPTAMIIDGIMSVIYGKKQQEEKPYILTENLKNFFEQKGLKNMNKIEIFEPAMCCSTGLCGVNVDKELLRIATTIDTLKKKGAVIERYNLSNAPKIFVTNKVVNEQINKLGTKVLPIILLNGEIVKTSSYPTNEEFEKWLNIKLGNNNSSASGCGCGSGCC